MSETMLHAVLKMPPELWGNDALDQSQRAARYIEASNLIVHLQHTIDVQVKALDELRTRLRIINASKESDATNDIEKRFVAYKNALELIAMNKAEFDNATAEMERDGMRLIAQVALNS